MTLNPPTRPWYELENPDDAISPSLLFYPDRIEENLRRMIAIAGDPNRLRPHVKTHKTPQVVRMHLKLGLTRFKAATIAEAEMLAQEKAPDVLVAYPLAGPNIRRFCDLIQKFPVTRFSSLADDRETVSRLANEASRRALKMNVLIDLDCGQHRTGIMPDERALDLCRLVRETPSISFDGLHAYDGHIHDSDLAIRREKCNAAFAPVEKLRKELEGQGIFVPRIVAGGTPTFPLHAQRQDIELSPGTCVLWDHGYATLFPDMDFQVAALVFTRVISRPQKTLLCLDLGHKAIASENPPPRVYFPDAPEARAIAHSEEHLVIETPGADRFKVGDVLYGIPRHICPTVALHHTALIVKERRVTEEWEIVARRRKISL